LASLLEEAANAAGADAYEHLHELRRADGEERRAGFAGDGAGEQRLTGAGRADEQHALGDLGADAQVLLRVLEEVDDLDELLLGCLVPGDVVEGGRDLVLAAEGLGARLSELHDLVWAALRPHEYEPEEADEDRDGQYGADEDAYPLGWVADGDLWHAAPEVFKQGVREDRSRTERQDRLRLAVNGHLGLGRELARDVARVAVDSHRGDAAVLHELREGGEGDLAASATGVELVEHEYAQDEEHHEQPGVEGSFQVLASGVPPGGSPGAGAGEGAAPHAKSDV